MIFFVSFGLSILGLIVSLLKALKKKNLLSPQFILFLGILFFLYVPALLSKSQYISDFGYNLALFIGVCGSLLTLIFFPYNLLEKRKTKRTINVKVFKLFALFYVSYLCYEIGKTIIQYGSISLVFSN